MGYTQRILRLLQTAVRHREINPRVETLSNANSKYAASALSQFTTRFSSVEATGNPLFTSLMADDMNGMEPFSPKGSRFNLNRSVYQGIGDSAKDEGGSITQTYWIHNHDLPNILLLLTERCVSVGSPLAGKSILPWSQVSSMYLDDIRRERSQILTAGKGSTPENSVKLQKDVAFHIVDGREHEIAVELLTHGGDEIDIGSVDEKRVGYNVLNLSSQDVVPFLCGDTIAVGESKATLCHELQDLVSLRKLYPTCRVDYNRVAFQPADHDHVRVSIDLNMRFLQERATHMEWRTPEDRFLLKDIVLCSYAMVEVTLSGPCADSPPAWVDQLLSSSMMHKVDKFSKRVHATYAFSLLEGNTLQLPEPSWWPNMMQLHPSIAILYNALAETATNAKLKAFNNSSKFAYSDPMNVFRNERTFLSWFSTAVYICGIGVSMHSTLPGHSNIIGVFLVILGTSFVGYSAYQNARRNKLMLLKVGKMYEYYDGYAPAIFSVVFAAIFIIAICLHVVVKKK